MMDCPNEMIFSFCVADQMNTPERRFCHVEATTAICAEEIGKTLLRSAFKIPPQSSSCHGSWISVCTCCCGFSISPQRKLVLKAGCPDLAQQEQRLDGNRS